MKKITSCHSGATLLEYISLLLIIGLASAALIFVFDIVQSRFEAPDEETSFMISSHELV